MELVSQLAAACCCDAIRPDGSACHVEFAAIDAGVAFAVCNVCEAACVVVFTIYFVAAYARIDWDRGSFHT